MKFSEVISTEDQWLLTEFIERYASSFDHHKNLTNPLSHIMRNWEIAKNDYLFKLLGNQVVLSKPYEWGITLANKHEMMRDMVRSSKHRTFIQAWKEIFDDMNIPRDQNYYHMANLLEAYGYLAENRVGVFLSVPMPDGKIYKVEPYTKAGKCIQKIAKAYNLPGYEDFILDHSMVLNQPTRDATLCLSIHPLDYLTMSENTSWSSCMKWSTDGDYRQGTVEMMNSPCVVCAYAYWDEFSILNSTLPETNWNNKRWRELFIVDRDIIVGVRPYPYEVRSLEADVVRWLRELAQANLGWEYDERVIWGSGEDGEYLYFDDHNGVQHEVTTETGYMYNDFYYEHPLVISPRIESDEVDNFTLDYSGYSQCMLCGGSFDGESHQVACDECDQGARCWNCGEYVSLEDLVEIDSKKICLDCVDSATCIDFFTGEKHLINNYIPINIYQQKENVFYRLENEDGMGLQLWVNCSDFSKFKAKYSSYQELREIAKNPWHYTCLIKAISIDEFSEDEFIKWFNEPKNKVLANLSSYSKFEIDKPIECFTNSTYKVVSWDETLPF